MHRDYCKAELLSRLLCWECKWLCHTLPEVRDLLNIKWSWIGTCTFQTCFNKFETCESCNCLLAHACDSCRWGRTSPVHQAEVPRIASQQYYCCVARYCWCNEVQMGLSLPLVSSRRCSRAWDSGLAAKRMSQKTLCRAILEWPYLNSIVKKKSWRCPQREQIMHARYTIQHLPVEKVPHCLSKPADLFTTISA